jgi:methyl-accepting chemotaxis protein
VVGVSEGTPTEPPRGTRGGSGSPLFRPISAVLLIVAVVGVAIAAIMLAWTMAVAQSIADKATVIANSGRGINASTDSIVQLNRTNEAAESILASVKPLPAELTTISGAAGDINSVAGSINASAGSINTSASAINTAAKAINTSAVTILGNAKRINAVAGPINSVAKDINSEASRILDEAELVDRDALNINLTLQPTIRLARDIKGDADDIEHQAVEARQTSSCIADKLFAGPPASTGDCFDDKKGRG